MTLPADVVEAVQECAGTAHQSVDRFVEGVLRHELTRWEAAFPEAAPAPDVQRALDADPAAASAFAAAGRRRRQSMLGRIDDARTPAGRERRIARTVDALRAGSDDGPDEVDQPGG